jgi:Holliday junction resolvasome RuvABC endonuclease subunit
MPDPRTILALDPGTRCGWAIRDQSGAYVSGVIDCRPGRHDSPAMRWIKLRKTLLELLDAYPNVGLVVYEDVRRHAGTDAAHIYGGMVAHIQALCHERNLLHTAIGVGIVKKRATGKGNADKAAMLTAARAKWPGHPFEDDNEADARHIAEAALVELAA